VFSLVISHSLITFGTSLVIRDYCEHSQ
jgi:hypothetical protein